VREGFLEELGVLSLIIWASCNIVEMEEDGRMLFSRAAVLIDVVRVWLVYL
jgi:hypothetical protein